MLQLRSVITGLNSRLTTRGSTLDWETDTFTTWTLQSTDWSMWDNTELDGTIKKSDKFTAIEWGSTTNGSALLHQSREQETTTTTCTTTTSTWLLSTSTSSTASTLSILELCTPGWATCEQQSLFTEWRLPRNTKWSHFDKLADAEEIEWANCLFDVSFVQFVN